MPLVKGRNVKLTTYILIVPRLKTTGTVSPLPHMYKRIANTINFMTYNKTIRLDVLLSELTGKLRERGRVRQADRHDEANCRLSQLCERAFKLR